MVVVTPGLADRVPAVLSDAEQFDQFTRARQLVLEHDVDPDGLDDITVAVLHSAIHCAGLEEALIRRIVHLLERVVSVLEHRTRTGDGQLNIDIHRFIDQAAKVDRTLVSLVAERRTLAVLGDIYVHIPRIPAYAENSRSKAGKAPP